MNSHLNSDETGRVIRVVGVGGALRQGSSTGMALSCALSAARTLGAETTMISGHDLAMPPYAPELSERTVQAEKLIKELRLADGIIIASPAYHGGISGLLKNALDYTEDLREDERAYFSGRPVGLIVTAGGPQASGSTLASLRSITHALRGWPTPLGVTINSASPVFDSSGTCIDSAISANIQTMVEEVCDFAWKTRNGS